MMQFQSMNEMWAQALLDLAERGRRHESRAGGTVEVVGWSGRLTDVDRNLLLSSSRRLDPAYASAELLWYLSGQRSVEMMCAYAPSYKRFANPQAEDGEARGAYGARWVENPGFMEKRGHVRQIKGIDVVNQLDAAAVLLSRSPETRQAVVTMWDSGDLCDAIIGDVNDVPCTVCMQFLRRDDRLHCCTYMRSNDVWLGMPYDVFCFTSIQRLLARRIGVRSGDYVHCVGSIHAYDRNFERSDLTRTAMEAGSTPSVPHGYDEDSGHDAAWDSDLAILSELRTRKRPELRSSGGFHSGGPFGDAAIVCGMAIGARTGFDVVPSEVRPSPALAEAWRIKRGEKA